MHPIDGRVVSGFIVQALAGKDITVFGNGSQTRSFCYVDDLLDGIIGLMRSDNDEIGSVNIGNPSECTISSLANLILDMTGSSSKIVQTPLPMDDPKQRCPAIRKAMEALGWAPKIALRDGLKRTISYFEILINCVVSISAVVGVGSGQFTHDAQVGVTSFGAPAALRLNLVSQLARRYASIDRWPSHVDERKASVVLAKFPKVSIPENLP